MDVELIVRVSKLVRGSLLERRREITKDFVRAGLSQYYVNDQFDVEDLKSKIEQTANVRIEDEALVYNLDELSSQGYVNHTFNLKYEIIKKIDIPKFQDLTQPVWDEFGIFLKERYDEFDPIAYSEIRIALDSILMRFATHLVQSQRTIIDILPFDDFRTIVEEEALALNIIWKNKFVSIFCEYIISKSPKLTKFISDRYSGIINMALMLKEREIPFLDLIDKVGFLLVDTSFLVALMCETDNTHALAVAVAKQCKKRNIPLYYLEETKHEMDNLIHGSKLEMQGLIVEGDPAIIRSQFVRDRKNRKNITWIDYYSELVNWQKIVRLLWDVTIIPKDYKPDDSVYDFVKLWLPTLDRIKYDERVSSHRYSRPLRDNQQIEHDAICLSIVAAARDEMETVQIGPWFLTFDNQVFGLSEFYSQIGKQKLSLAIQPRTWLNYLLTYSKMEFNEEDLNSVAEAVILFTTGARDSKITLQDYNCLITEKLGLESEDCELMMELFLKSPLLVELERALESGHGGDADRITQKIITDKQFIDSVVSQRKIKKDYQRVSSKLSELDRQYHEERAAREALERCSGHNIYIKTEVKTTLDISLQSQINGLVTQLEALLPGGFEEYNLPKPPKGETQDYKLKDWLKRLKEGITTSKNVTDDAKAIIENLKMFLPYIMYLIGQFK